jgi:hypothetical protein
MKMKCGVFFSKIIVACAALLSFHSAAWATSISLSGNYTYQYSGSYVVMSADKISNNTSGGYSGTLRMELWAFSTPYTGASQTGYKLATYQLPQQLNGGQYYANVSSGSVAATYPPSGTWYISLLIGEYTASGWTTATYGNFSNVMTCSGGYCTTGTTPTTTTLPRRKRLPVQLGGKQLPALFAQPPSLGELRQLLLPLLLKPERLSGGFFQRQSFLLLRFTHLVDMA